MADGRERVTPERNPAGAVKEEAPKAQTKKTAAKKKLTQAEVKELLHTTLASLVAIPDFSVDPPQDSLLTFWVQGRQDRAIWYLSDAEIKLEVEAIFALAKTYPVLMYWLERSLTSSAVMQFIWVQVLVFRPRILATMAILRAQKAAQQPGYQEATQEQWTARNNGATPAGAAGQPGFPDAEYLFPQASAG